MSSGYRIVVQPRRTRVKPNVSVENDSQSRCIAANFSVMRTPDSVVWAGLSFVKGEVCLRW